MPGGMQKPSKTHRIHGRVGPQDDGAVYPHTRALDLYKFITFTRAETACVCISEREWIEHVQLPQLVLRFLQRSDGFYRDRYHSTSPMTAVFAKNDIVHTHTRTQTVQPTFRKMPILEGR